MAHVVYYERVNGPSPEGNHVHHRCEQPSCVNPDHLESLTPAEHKQTHSRLDWSDVREIRRRRAQGERNVDVARLFGVSPGTVSNITSGHTWREVA